ncbi:MAG: hypothetical protein LBC02_11065, partial [Planctomycetaceae bacterium]|nr:hypothetical protein [Planctomycetaceae bacterium]
INATVGGNTAFDAGTTLTIDNTDKSETSRKISLTGSLSAIAGTDLTIQNIHSLTSGNTGTLTATSGNILVNDVTTLDFVDALSATAGINLTVQNVNSLTSGNTGTLTATLGDLLVKDVTKLNFDNVLTAKANNNLTFTDSALTVKDKATLTTTHGDLTIENSSLNTGTNALTAIAETDLSIENVTTTAGTTNLTAHNNLAINDSSLTLGQFTAIAKTDILIENVTTTADETNLTAENNNLAITDSSLTLGQFTAIAEHDILISNVTTTADETKLIATAGDLTMNEGSFNIGTNALTAIAQKNLSLINTVTTAGTTILTALTENVTLSGKTAQFDNAKITVGQHVELNNNIVATIIGNQNNSDGKALTIISGNDILFGGIVRVTGTRDVTLTAQNGKIADRNSDEINLDAVASNVTLIAAEGIGADDAIELKAKTLDFEVTGTGSASINSLADITINNVKTANGLIDFYGDGAVVVGDVFAGGNDRDFILGMTNGVTFRANGKVTAGKHITIIAQNGDIYSAAQNVTESVQFDADNTNFIALTGKIYGNADINNGFITTFKKGITNIISNGDLLVYETSEGNVEYGTIISGGKISILSARKGNVSIDKIVASQINFNQELMQLSELTNNYYTRVSSVIDEDISKTKIISQNKTLLDKEFDIYVDQIQINNKAEDATLNINNVSIDTDTNYTILIDNFVIDQINADNDGSLTHQGGSKEIADTILVKNIVSTGDFYFDNMKTDWLEVYTDSVNGAVQVFDSYIGNRANYDINGVSVIVDSQLKNYSGVYSYFRYKETTPDFRIWSLDSKYEFDVTNSALLVDHPSMRVLNAFHHHLTLNNEATYVVSAFEDLLVDDRTIVNQATLRLTEVNRQSFERFDIDRVNGLISGYSDLLMNNVGDSIRNLLLSSPPIVPVIDEEKNKTDNEENNSENNNITITAVFPEKF